MVVKFIKDYCKGLKLEIAQLVDSIKKLLVIMYMRGLKRRAMRLHKFYNCQFFVVKILGRVRVISKKRFTHLRQHGKIPLHITATELKKIAFFYTPARYDKKRVQRPTGSV